MKTQWTADEFKNPPAEFRGAPFWAWNNRLDSEQLKRQIGYFKEMGMGGYHIHCRVGLDTPYLGEEFMRCVAECSEEGKKQGLYTYLYDEDRWPSGAAGGLVTKNPAYRSRHLLFVPECMIREENENRRLLAVYEIWLENGFLKKYIRRTEPKGAAEAACPADAGLWRLYLEIAEPTPWHNNQTYIDTLNKKAVERFVEVTHESYYSLLGDEFGKSIPSIFTDEPQFVRKETLDFADEKKPLILPYTDEFEAFYQQRFHESFLDHFPEVVWELADGKLSAVRYQYHEGIAELFASSFADTVGGWCEKHHLMLTGHMMEEPTLLSQTSALGEAMRSYRSFQQPGIDMLCDWREYTTAKQAQSAAHQFSRCGVLSELYGVTNWDFDFRGHKLQGDWQAALGVTRRVPHLSWVSMKGEAKRDYPASIFYQSPWYKEYKMVEDHFARVNTALMRGTPHVRVGVIHPIESYWLHFGPKEQTAQIREVLEQEFRDLTEWLLFGTIDFDFIAESLMETQSVAVRNQQLQVGSMKYDVILVPGCETLRSSTVSYLNTFRENGGNVIFAGRLPDYIDAKWDSAGRALAQRCVQISMDRIEVQSALEPYREIEIRRPDGRRADCFLYQMREADDGRWLFLANGTKPQNQDLPRRITYQIRIWGDWRVEICDTQTGNIRICEALTENNWTSISHRMDLHDSLLLHLTPADNRSPYCSEVEMIDKKCFAEGRQVLNEDAAAGQPKAFLTVRREQCLPQPDGFELNEPNVLLLDQCEYQLDKEGFHESEEILRIDNKIRERLGYPKRMEAWPQPWVQKDCKRAEHTVTMRFKIFSETACDPVYLALENVEDALVIWNGKTVEKKICGWYVDESLTKIELGTVLPGDNSLIIQQPFGEKTNLEWLYLLGDFGVRVAGKSAWLTALPKRQCFGDYTVQGLPFYAGNIKYSVSFTVREGRYALQISRFRTPLLKISVDGGEWKPIAYAPYEAELGYLTEGMHRLEIISFGNRINAFGTVHNCDETTEWFGPNEWRTENESYSYEYQLKRMGILKTPVIFSLSDSDYMKG